MRVFTVKDLLLYNNPCFCCGYITKFFVGRYSMDSALSSNIVPILSEGLLETNLKTTYQNSINLIIKVKNNNIIYNKQSLETYLKEYLLSFKISCDSCNSVAWTETIEFNLDKGFILPVKLSAEILFLQDEENLYTINTNYNKNSSHVVVDKINGTKPISPWQTNVPALSLLNFKTKKDIINKIKIYMAFS